MKTDRNKRTGNFANNLKGEKRNMKSNGQIRAKILAPTIIAILTVSLACLYASNTEAFGYDFSANSQGWKYMGLYDGNGLNPVDDFTVNKNPWTGIDGQGGAIEMGQEGFTPQSPTGNAWVHGDFNSPDLTFRPKSGAFALEYDITGAHMSSTAMVYVQAVVVVRLPNEISDRRLCSDFFEVPLAEDGAWDTHTLFLRLPAGTVYKKVNLRIFFETSSIYWGWIMVDNVVIH